MLKSDNKIEKAGVTKLDLRIAVSVLICALTATLLTNFGIVFDYGGRKLEILQKMTACISCLLLCQDNTQFSFKAGINRLVITAVGGVVGVVVTLIDVAVGSSLLMVLMIAFGVLLTLFLCKICRVPYINARIGGVTFVLVSCTLNEYGRIWYAIFRFGSTLYAALVVLLVTWVFTKLSKKA